jgi:Flp pilus assembly protein TadB
MAQTKKKKRSTKHRGNAAGMVENRGRTGRPLSDAEKRSQTKLTASQRRLAKMEQPPSWRSATNRAVIASLIFGVALFLLFGQDLGPVLALVGFMFFVYIPLGYYTDMFIYKRRMKQKAKG